MKSELRLAACIVQSIVGAAAALLLMSAGFTFGGYATKFAAKADSAVVHAQINGRANTSRGYMTEGAVSPGYIPSNGFHVAATEFAGSAVIADQTAAAELTATADRYQTIELWFFGGVGASALIFGRGLLGVIGVVAEDK